MYGVELKIATYKWYDLVRAWGQVNEYLGCGPLTVVLMRNLSYCEDCEDCKDCEGCEGFEGFALVVVVF